MDFEHGGIPPNMKGDMIDFSSNVNPLPFPRAIKRLKDQLFESLKAYPDPHVTVLSEKISSILGVRKEEILFGNGSSELIYLVVQALKPKTVVIPEPTFSEYERASRAHGARILKVRLAKDFTLPLSSIPDADMLFLCHPNNPTGNYLITRREDLLKLSVKYLVVDEAYIEFQREGWRHSFLPCIREDTRLIVLRTFTKLFPLAGARIGYLIANTGVVERVRAFKPPWNVSGPAMLLASFLLQDWDFVEKTRRLIEKEKAYLTKHLRALNFEPYPSVTNFLLLRLNGHQSSRELRERLLEKGILVRECSNFGLGEGFLRVAVRTRKDNKRLIEALREICLSA